MTPEELAKLSPEEKRVKIALACGIHVNADGWLGKTLNDAALPDYLNSLDAMHEAEKALTQSQCFAYRDILQSVVLKEVAACSADFVFGANAVQRADAFLLTL